MAGTQCLHISKVLPQYGDLFSPYVVNCVVMSVLSLTAIVGNVLILASICRAQQFLRQPSHFLLVNLAFADLCVGFLAEPAYLVYKISYLVNPFSVLSCYAGITFNFLSYFLTSLSLWTAAAISLDRLLALHLHMKYFTIVTKSRVCILIVVLLALSTVFASMFEWALDAQNTVFVCADSLALLIALLSYVRIFQIVRYHQRQISIQLTEVSFRQKEENDSMRTSLHGKQDNREQLFLVSSEETGGNREMVNIKSSGIQTIETETQGNRRDLELQEMVSTEHWKNQRYFSVSEGLCGQQQLQEQTKIVKTKGKSRNEQRQNIGQTTTVGTKEENHEIKLSSVARTLLQDEHVPKILNQQTEKTEVTEVGKENKESRPEPPADNTEVIMTEIQFIKSVRDGQNKNSVELQGEFSVFEDVQADTGSPGDKNCFLKKTRQSYNLKHALTEEITPVFVQKTPGEEQAEVSSSEENNSFQRYHQKCYQNCATAEETMPDFVQQTHGEEKTEVSSSEENNPFQRCHQNCYQNYALAEESLTPAERQETHQKEIEVTAAARPSEDNNCFERMHEIQNAKCGLADDTTPVVIQETGQEENNKTEAMNENCVNPGRETNNTARNHNQVICSPANRRTSSDESNATINNNQRTNRSSKGFKMRHFKKSVFDMFIIWFIMLLCYLPLICISTLVLFLGRSYSMHLAFNFTTSVMFVNSSINPIVFCWRIREFRAAVRKTLREVFGFWANQSNIHDSLNLSTQIVN